VKELRLLVKVKNNRLLERREGLELSQVAMSQVIGMPTPNYADLENLRAPPVKSGEWTRDALKVAEYFDCDPEELFPDAVLAVREPTAERSVDGAEVSPLLLSSHSEQLLLPPDEQLQGKESLGKVRNVLATLHPREQDVLRKYYGLDDDGRMTIDQIASSDPEYPKYEKVRQVIESSLGKMRKNYEYLAGDTSVMRNLSTASPPAWASELSRPIVRANTRVIDLVDRYHGTVTAIRQARDAACAAWPRLARIVAEVEPLYAKTIFLTVVLPTTVKVNLTEAAQRLQPVAGKSYPCIRVYVRQHDYPATARKKIERVAEDARAGGFEVLEIGRRKIVLARGAGDPRDDVMKMRLWFCDRADLVKIEAGRVTWSPAPEKVTTPNPRTKVNR
jgi:hypothetical protein